MSICIYCYLLRKGFPNAEHAFQWKKFSASHRSVANIVLLAKSPYLVKEISDANKDKLPPTWREERVAVMEEILCAKATQHQDVCDILKKTGGSKIIENSPVDSFWGIGPEGNVE